MNSLTPTRDLFLIPIQEEVNKLFDRLFSNDGLQSIKSKMRSGYPKMDLLESPTQFIVECELPGVEEADLKLEILPPNEISGGRKILRLNGKKDASHQYAESTVWHIKELRRSQFTRELVLPDGIEDNPVATYDKGILKLVFQKKKKNEPESNIRLIPIVKLA